MNIEPIEYRQQKRGIKPRFKLPSALYLVGSKNAGLLSHNDYRSAT